MRLAERTRRGCESKHVATGVLYSSYSVHALSHVAAGRGELSPSQSGKSLPRGWRQVRDDGIAEGRNMTIFVSRWGWEAKRLFFS